ncbi:hypothetical protein GGI25_003888 [Coemansia spiralis]|uniref:protein-serine/threonine phosphatase n=2 Tax=Coemansia TaxID=4863 RepID=A0A9W8G5U0_9FUNG|nr:ubiquitin-like domain-containing CTD phosphatase [Coemansia spiralis]KAJ1991065.1 hypothetical protein EDC05_003666 [Coemansia umbellata]KAJ2621122.1 hypothetical protein GGI26_004385 [Coemansia sp. RSA 1358]KAJ2675690.1 hypothetical protein GGI25_003888 [Coemansia spiralis]
MTILCSEDSHTTETTEGTHETAPEQPSAAQDELSRESLALEVFWKGTEQHSLRVSKHATILSVKVLIEELTGVDVEGQKLLGLVKGILPKDTCTLANLGIRSGTRVRLVGTRAAERLQPQSDNVDFNGRVVVSQDHVDRLDLIVRTAEIRIINEPRAMRKLAVLDLDYTLLDCSRRSGNVVEMARPGLHEFLTAIYPHYDLIVWSQTKWFYVESKITMMGMLTHPRYRLVAALDISTMVWVDMAKRGVVSKRQVKPLEFIWRRFPENYGPHNTVHVDDLRSNFALNRQNGLRVSQFRGDKTADTELYRLADYMVRIAKLPSLESLDHSKWYDYK